MTSQLLSRAPKGGKGSKTLRFGYVRETSSSSRSPIELALSRLNNHLTSQPYNYQRKEAESIANRVSSLQLIVHMNMDVLAATLHIYSRDSPIDKNLLLSERMIDVKFKLRSLYEKENKNKGEWSIVWQKFEENLIRYASVLYQNRL